MDSIVEQARAFVDDAYRGADDEKGLAHSHEVGELLAELGYDDDVVATGLLHDVVEDTGIDIEEVRNAFGDTIADLVYALSEDADIRRYAERKKALREGIAIAGPTALVISGSDKLARVRAADRRGQTLSARKLEHYERTLEMLATYGIHTAHTAELERRLRLQRLRRRAAPAPDIAHKALRPHTSAFQSRR
ncbi:MAG TPA: HD domain-containing protein [Baekduia sp.]|nr:HD domain-containing protein [Baekduia sp.]